MLKLAGGGLMRVVGYGRVSTEAQADNTSLALQEERYHKWCAARNAQSLGFFTDVATGANTDRPGLKAALKAVRKADALAVVRVDRLSRSTLDVLTILLRKLTPFSRRLAVIEMECDSLTAIGVLQITMMAAFAEYERNLIHERTQSGKLAKATEGGYVHGSPAFGWMAQGKALVASAVETTVVRLISRLRKQGLSLRDIAQRLQADGYATKRGGKWHPSIISKILRRIRQK